MTKCSSRGNSVADATQPDHAIAECAIVHVDRAGPGDPARIDLQRIALLQMIVEHRREQRVRARDRVKVSREMEIDVIHRNDLRVSAAGGSALHTEDRTEAWLANAQRNLLTHSPKRLRQSNRYRALSFAGRSRIGRGDDDEASADRPLRDVERNLRFILSIEIELVAREAQLRGDVLDGTHFDALRDFDVRRNDGNSHVMLLLVQVK
jgi:hypothetical protein